MGLVLSDIFFFDVDRLEVIGESLSRVLLGHGLEWVDNDQAVPEAGVNLLLSQSPLQLQEDLGCVDDVHFDEIPLH